MKNRFKLTTKVILSLVCLPLYLSSILAIAQETEIEPGVEPVEQWQPFSTATTYNAFILEGFEAFSSDIQGRLAAGGDIRLSSYSIASELETAPEDLTLVSGADIYFENGRVHTGSIAAVGSVEEVMPPVIDGLQEGAQALGEHELPFSFREEFDLLESYSKQLSELEATGTVEYKWGGAYLTGDCDSDFQVFNLDGLEIYNSHTFGVECVPAEATIIFNLSGLEPGFTNVSLFHLNSNAHNIVYNFYEAEIVNFSNIAVEGSVLAPKAHFNTSWGHVNGTVIGKSWSGPMELHHVPFTGDLDFLQPPRANQSPVITSEPVVTAEVGVVYQYPVTATDADNDTLTYQLATPPEGMGINEESGVITWTPTTHQLPTQQVTVRVTDPYGGFDEQAYEIAINAANEPPVIISEPSSPAIIGQPYQYPVVAVDPDPGDSVTYSLNDAPEGFDIDPQTGVLSWLPDDAVWRGSQAHQNNHCLLPAGGDAEGSGAADIVVVVDESGSMSGEHEWIRDIALPLEARLLANGIGDDEIGNRYGLIGYLAAPHPITVSSGDMGDWRGLYSATEVLRTSGGTEDGWNAMHHALTEYPLREKSARNIILITDEGRDNANDSITYNSMLADLEGERAVLNAVVNARFVCTDTSGEEVEALGMDSSGVGYLADGQGGYGVCADARATWGHTNTLNTLEAYVPLALESGGAAWDLDFLRAGGHLAESFVAALMDIKVREIREQLSPRPAPDLHVLSITYREESVDVVVRNRGLTHVTEPMTISLYAGDELADQQDFPSLEAEESQTLSFSVPESQEAQTLAAEIQPQNALTECNTENNRLQVPWVNVQATDTGGLYDTQRFSLALQSNGSAPVIISDPVTQASANALYEYVLAVNYAGSGDSVLYDLVDGPAGMEMDILTGHLSFIPAANQVGEHEVELEVTDTLGQTDTQSFTLVIDDAYQVPLFTSDPFPRAVQNTDFIYQPEIDSDEVDGLTFSLVVGPEGMTVDPERGTVNWQVPDDHAGQIEPIALLLEDETGNHSFQFLTLFGDIPNEPPVITSLPNDLSSYNRQYSYNAQVNDDNYYDIHQWDLTYNPDSASVDVETGRVLWPTAGRPVDHLQLPRYDLLHQCSENTEALRDLSGHVTAEYSGYSNAGQPLVGPLGDDNADGIIDGKDDVAVVILSSASGNQNPVNAVDLRTGELLWQTSERPAYYQMTPAMVDLTNSGEINIVYMDIDRHLVALRPGGSIRWVSDQPVAPSNANFNHSSIVFADLNGDGELSILAGPSVFNAHGELQWRFNPISGNHSYQYRGPAYAVDLTGDGLKEVAYYDQVRTHSGALLWETPSTQDATVYHAHFADMDLTGDGNLELIISERTSRGRRLSAVDRFGDIVWMQDGDDVSGAGPLLVADFTGNGVPDIFSTANVALFNTQGHTIWRKDDAYTQSDHATASVADINGDGELNIMMRGTSGAWILSGQTGASLALWPSTGSRGFPAPILVQPFDEDTVVAVLGTHHGFSVLTRSWGEEWRAANRSFNHAGQRIGQFSVGSRWQGSDQPPLVMAASNSDGEGTSYLADLRLASLSGLGDTQGVDLTVSIRNDSFPPMPAGSQVILYRDDIEPGNILASQNLGEIPGYSTEDVVFSGLEMESLGDRVIAQVISADADMECETRNQSVAGYLFGLEISDYEGATDQQYWLVGLEENNWAATLNWSMPSSTVVGEALELTVSGSSDNIIDNVYFRLLEGPDNMTLNPLTGDMHWIPRADQLGTQRVRVQLYGRGSGGTHTRTITVLPAPDNQPPGITSTPLAAASVGQAYQYVIKAQDPDGDRVEYRLEEGPEDVHLHPRTGLLLWAPRTDSPDSVEFTVRAEDPYGAADTQTFSVTVHSGINQAPHFTSQPPLQAALGTVYQYSISVEDPDGDPLTVDLVQAPDGVSWDADNWTLSWTPIDAQLGVQEFVARVEDNRGGWSEQSFTVHVNDASQNQPPAFVSEPPSSVVLGATYNYQAQAEDPDGDDITYILAAGPPGTSIHASTGQLHWTSGQTGSFNLQLQALDGRGGIDVQSFTVQVTESGTGNQPPSWLTQPPTTGKVGYEYRYAFEAEDPDGDEITYSLEQAPDSMALSGQTLTWTPGVEGTESVRLRASAGEHTSDQVWTLSVADTDAPLTLALHVQPSVVEPGETVTVSLEPLYAAGALEATLTLNGEPVELSAVLTAEVSGTDLGAYTLEATVSDAFEAAHASGQFVVRDPEAADGPIVSLSTPDYEANITAPTDIIGTVYDDDLSHWTLTYAESGTTDWTLLAEGADAVEDDLLGQFDPTLLRNGQYRIALQAWNQLGQYGSDTREVQVTGDMKVGHFSVTFEDASIPLVGFPLVLTRTYDTRDSHKSMDFGHGWSQGYRNVRIHEARTIGFGWSLHRYRYGLFGAFTDWCVESNGDNIVTITMPDDEVYRFKAKASPECQQFVPAIDFHIAFEPLEGTSGTLEILDYGMVRYVEDVGLIELGEAGLVDPSRYRLTLDDGTVMDIDKHSGITRVVDTHDNTLTFTEDGIEHSSGVGIEFVRDDANRITQVQLPDGNQIDYFYTPQGDLTGVADQLGELTQFNYLADIPHYLDEIIDPRGVTVARNEYDDDGRLVASIDADGNRIEYEHDIEGRTQVIRNRLGQATTYVYNDRGDVISETNALGETTTRSYDEHGNMLSETDALHNTTAWTYDVRGNQTSMTDPLGNTTRYYYDSRNQIARIEEPDGTVSMENTYHGLHGSLTRMTDALGNTHRFTYFARGVIDTSTDPMGNDTLYGYNSRGDITRRIEPSGADFTMTYDDMGNKLTETELVILEDDSELSLVTHYQYDAKGRLTRTTHPDGTHTRIEYNRLDQEAARIDELGRRTEYAYNDRGELIRTTYPDGTTETVGYDAEGNEIARTDRLGRTTRMVYDDAGRLVETLYPDATPEDLSDNPRQSAEYDRAGRRTRVIDPNGNITRYTYDRAGRQTRVYDALGRATVFDYNNRGQRTRVTDALSRETEYRYDAADRLVETLYPDGTSTTVDYNALGQRTAVTDPGGLTTRFEYDASGNLTAVIDPLEQRTEYGYDSRGLQTRQTDAAGRTTRWAYDARGRQISRTLPDGQSESFAYDDAGNLARHTDFNGQRTDYTYDHQDRLTEVSYADGSRELYSYDSAGNRTRAEQIDSLGHSRVTEYRHDVRDRLIEETQPNGAVLAYEYDDNGNRTRVTLTAGGDTRITDTHYDRLDRPTRVIADGQSTYYSYNQVGSRTQLRYPNGTRTDYDYDQRDRLTQVVTTRSGIPLQRFDYTLDDSGRRTRIETLDGTVTEYQYDDLGRMTAETITDAVGITIHSASYSHDAAGNRQSQTVNGQLTSYLYNPNDWLTEHTGPEGTTTYSFDANGNTLTELGPEGLTEYRYNSRNQLTSLEQGGSTTSYAYNAEGIRTRKTENGLATDYVVDSNRPYAQVLKETGPDSAIWYDYGDDLIAQIREEGTFHYHYDGLGSTRGLSDSSGALTDTWDYQAFGEVLGRTGETENSYLFTGEQFDQGLDQYYLRARYYDQQVGRFTQMDAYMGRNHEPATLHKYLYVHGDPVNLVDPSGHFSLVSFGAASSIRATLSTMAQATIRVVVRVGQRGWKSVKSRPWVINRVKLSPHALSHEFIWAYNRKTRKGFGYHVQAPLREAARTAFTPEFIQGVFSIIPQKRANVIAGRRVSVTSKERVAFLGTVGFAMWSAMTVGTMSAGDSCSFSYNIPKSSCVTWTNKAARNARFWQVFPL